MSLEHLRPIYDDLPESVAGRIATLMEGMSALNDLEWEQTAFETVSNPPSGDAILSNVRPTVHLALQWEAEAKSAVWNDLEAIQSELGAYDANIRINGDPAPKEDPAGGNSRLTEFKRGGTPDAMEAEATLKVPVFTRSYSQREDFLHGDLRMDNGPSYRVVDKWNNRGVRCLLVKRWVPIPDEWEGTPIKYWTGYTYLGGHPEDYETGDHEYSHWDLPETVGDPGAPLPRVTYPDESHGIHATGGSPDGNGWIGWDNNFDGEDAPPEGPEEVHMSEADAKEVTDLLAKGVRLLWESEGVEPEDVYEDGVEPPVFAEEAEVV